MLSPAAENGQDQGTVTHQGSGALWTINNPPQLLHKETVKGRNRCEGKLQISTCQPHNLSWDHGGMEEEALNLLLLAFQRMHLSPPPSFNATNTSVGSLGLICETEWGLVKSTAFPCHVLFSPHCSYACLFVCLTDRRSFIFVFPVSAPRCLAKRREYPSPSPLCGCFCSLFSVRVAS